MADYNPQPLAWSLAPQRPNVNTLWAPQASNLVDLRQQILGHSQEIMELSRQLQASQLQTGYTISQNISDVAAPRAPQVSDAVDLRYQMVDYSQRIAELSQQLRVSQFQTMQSLPSPPVSPRYVLPTQAMSNSPFSHAMSQNFLAGGGGGGGAPHKAPQISDPMQIPQQIMNYSQQIADLSRQLRISQSQTIQINQNLSQMPPFSYPVPQNAQYSDPSHSQSPYPFYPTAGNSSAYCPVAAIPSPPMSALEFTPRQWAGGLPNGFVPQPVSTPLTPKLQSSGSPTVSGYHQYGDCGESLPLAAMTNLLKLTGRAEVRSVSAFTTRLRGMAFMLEDGPIMVPVRLRDPCLNCESLMHRLPGTVNMLAASGWSQDISWVAVNKPACVTGVLSSGFRTSYETSGKYEFSLSAAYGATREEIYSTLEVCTLTNANPFIFSADIKRYLADLWYGFVVPYRDNGAIFRLDQDDNVKPIMLTTNGINIPICTVFCAIGYILSTVLWPDRVAAQRESSYLPLMSILAKWCYTLCPWAHPNVVSVAYVTSREPDVDALFLLGTSKPSAKPGAPLEYVQPKHTAQMRSIRKVLLETHFGRLPNPCPVKVAADARN